MRNMFVLFSAVLLCIGCGPRSLFPIEPVEGVVTLDGKPIAEVTVNFIPQGEGKGMPAAARTKEDGSYKLTAYSGGLPEKGTKVGQYNVTLVYDRRARLPTEQEIDYMRRGGKVEIPLVHVVPQKYNEVSTSGYTAEVVKGTNVFNFDLVTK